MPRLTVTVFPTQEPAELAMLKAQVRVDGTAEDALLTQKLSAARDAVERHCGRPWASCTVEQTFEVGEPYERLPGAGPATAVRGYYTDLADLDKLTDAGYQAEYLKGISVSRDEPIGGWGYGAQRETPTYTVTYPVTVAPAQVPPAVKEAILKLAADLYENRETSGGALALLPVSYRVLLAPYRLTNPFFD